jgi:hypothetical protein
MFNVKTTKTHYLNVPSYQLVQDVMRTLSSSGQPLPEAIGAVRGSGFTTTSRLYAHIRDRLDDLAIQSRFQCLGRKVAPLTASTPVDLLH